MRNLIYIFVLLSTTAFSAGAQQWRVSSLVRDDAVLNGTSGQRVFELYDSTRFTYSYNANRGSSGMLNDSIAYDQKLRLTLDTSSKLVPWEKWERTYYNDNTLASETFLTAYSTPLQYRSSDSFTYDNGRVKTHIHYELKRVKDTNGFVDKVIPTEKYQFDYYTDVQQDVVESLTYNYDYATSIFSPRTKQVLRYDANGKKVADTTYRFNTVTGWVLDHGSLFVYTTNGTTGAISDKYEIYYYVYKNKLDSFNKNEYTYNAKGELIRDLKLNKTDTGYVKTSGHKYSYHPNGLLLSDTSSRYDVDGTVSFRTIKEYTYTTNDLLSTVLYLYGLQSPFVYDARDRYNYELYWPVSTLSTQNNVDDFTAYPVPSSNFINLKWQADKPTTIHARIVNLQGQVVKQWSDKVEGVYIKSIHVGELPAGNYIVIFDAEGMLLHKEVSILH